MVRRNNTGRIYGVTFIDHNSKTLWNGSRLSKGLSATIFNDYWNNNIKPNIKEPAISQPSLPTLKDADLLKEDSHQLFEFLTIDKHEGGLIEALDGLLIPKA